MLRHVHDALGEDSHCGSKHQRQSPSHKAAAERMIDVGARTRCCSAKHVPCTSLEPVSLAWRALDARAARIAKVLSSIFDMHVSLRYCATARRGTCQPWHRRRAACARLAPWSRGPVSVLHLRAWTNVPQASTACVPLSQPAASLRWRAERVRTVPSAQLRRKERTCPRLRGQTRAGARAVPRERQRPGDSRQHTEEAGTRPPQRSHRLPRAHLDGVGVRALLLAQAHDHVHKAAVVLRSGEGEASEAEAGRGTGRAEAQACHAGPETDAWTRSTRRAAHPNASRVLHPSAAARHRRRQSKPTLRTRQRQRIARV